MLLDLKPDQAMAWADRSARQSKSEHALAYSQQLKAALQHHLRRASPLRRVVQIAVQFEVQQMRVDLDQLLA
jgi:hypothetical protein